MFGSFSGGSGGAPGSVGSSGWWGCLWSWLIKSIIPSRENNDEIPYHEKVEKARKTFEIVGEKGEVEAMCEEAYQRNPELNLYWNSDSPFSQFPTLPDDENIQHPEETVEDEKSKRFEEMMIVGMAPVEKGIDGHGQDRREGQPAETDIKLASDEKKGQDNVTD